MAFLQFNPNDCELDLSQCGVYIIYTLCGVYIGASTEIDVRWDNHQLALKVNCHICKRLQRAKVRYGLKGLRRDVLEYCPRESLYEAEVYWHKVYKALGFKVFS